MKIPKMYGRNKIRDTRICQLWLDEGIDPDAIAEKYHISVRRVNQILYRSREFLTLDTLHEKNRRLHNLKKWEKEAESPKSNKLTIQQEIRREIEGESPLIDNSIHNTYQQVKVVIDDNSDISSALKSRVSPSRPK